MKKTIALLLLLVMALGLVACGEEPDAPVVDGYQIVSIESDPFYLYVPNSWKNNASSGISSAFYGTNGNVMVSALFVKSDEPLLAMYMARVLESFQKTLEDFAPESELQDFTLSSNAAYWLDYSAKVGGKSQKFRTYVASCKGGYTHLTYSADTVVFANYLIDFEQIVNRFVFKGQTPGSSNTTPDTAAPDSDVIEGWQLASSSSYEFKFFVPKSWTVDKSVDVPTATIGADNGDNSNVTMMSYVLTDPTMTAEKYWEKTKEDFLYDMEVLATDDSATLGGLPAYAVEYKTGLVDMQFRIKQVFCVTSNMVYVFTYTSNDYYYASHMNSVDAMLEYFLFK